MTWDFDRVVDGGCSRRRPEILLDMGDYVVVVEIDENQQQYYDCVCENKAFDADICGCGFSPSSGDTFQS